MNNFENTITRKNRLINKKLKPHMCFFKVDDPDKRRIYIARSNFTDATGCQCHSKTLDDLNFDAVDWVSVVFY